MTCRPGGPRGRSGASRSSSKAGTPAPSRCGTRDRVAPRSPTARTRTCAAAGQCCGRCDCSWTGGSPSWTWRRSSGRPSPATGRAGSWPGGSASRSRAPCAATCPSAVPGATRGSARCSRTTLASRGRPGSTFRCWLATGSGCGRSRSTTRRGSTRAARTRTASAGSGSSRRRTPSTTRWTTSRSAASSRPPASASPGRSPTPATTGCSARSCGSTGRPTWSARSATGPTRRRAGAA